MPKPLPYTAEDLIQELDQTYPERCPSPSAPERDIWIMVGQRMLVRNLLARLEEHDSNPLRTTHVLQQAEDAPESE